MDDDVNNAPTLDEWLASRATDDPTRRGGLPHLEPPLACRCGERDCPNPAQPTAQEMLCTKCRTAYTGGRFCPRCGYEALPPQPTAQEAERAEGRAWRDFANADAEREPTFEECFRFGYRRGRAEGEYVGSLLHQTCPTTKDIEAEIANVRAENARLREAIPPMHGTALARLEARLAAAERGLQEWRDAEPENWQREKRLREALEDALQCMEYTLRNHRDQITGTAVMAERIVEAEIALAEEVPPRQAYDRLSTERATDEAGGTPTNNSAEGGRTDGQSSPQRNHPEG